MKSASLHSVQIIGYFCYSEAKTIVVEKGHFNMFVVKKRFCDDRCSLNFFPVNIENLPTWSDCRKKLPSKSCLLGIRKSNKHCSKVISLLAKEFQKNPSYGHTRIILDFVDQNAGWGTLHDILHVAPQKNVKGRTLHDILHKQQVLRTHAR